MCSEVLSVVAHICLSESNCCLRVLKLEDMKLSDCLPDIINLLRRCRLEGKKSVTVNGNDEIIKTGVSFTALTQTYVGFSKRVSYCGG